VGEKKKKNVDRESKLDDNGPGALKNVIRSGGGGKKLPGKKEVLCLHKRSPVLSGPW